LDDGPAGDARKRGTRASKKMSEAVGRNIKGNLGAIRSMRLMLIGFKANWRAQCLFYRTRQNAIGFEKCSRAGGSGGATRAEEYAAQHRV
jgi:hypothetical protein